MRYVEIAVDVPAPEGDRLAAELVGEGLAVEQRDATTLLKPPPGRALLIVWAEVPAAGETRSLVEDVLRREGVVAEVALAERDEDEWRDVWKQFFTPRTVGPFAIVPTWHREGYAPKPEETVILIDPGRAFGTGGHASTRLCLELLGGQPEPAAVLDVGCGSGVLGIACVLRWPACRVTAIDVDPEAAATARENAALNGVADRIDASTTPLAAVPGAFDIVLANIQADVLDRLRDSLVAHLAPGGRIALSGLLAEQGEEMARRFEKAGLLRLALVGDEGWAAVLLERPAGAEG